MYEHDPDLIHAETWRVAMWLTSRCWSEHQRSRLAPYIAEEESSIPFHALIEEIMAAVVYEMMQLAKVVRLCGQLDVVGDQL